MSISVRIREAREKNGLSQAELAVAVGVTRGACGHWEQGKSSPSLDNLAKIAIALGVHFEWLATGRGPRDYVPEELVGMPKEYFPDRQRNDDEVTDLISELKNLPPTSRSHLLGFLRSLPVISAT